MNESQLIIKAPAKINLTLEIQGKEKDGFHSLESVFLAVSLYDVLEISSIDLNKIKFTSNMESNIGRDSNTVVKAAEMLQKRTRTNKGAKIHLEKKIPLGSGLGGGSSDAAGALRGLVNLWNLEDGEIILKLLVPHIGSDVPFFLTGGCALVQGRGEKVTPIPMNTEFYIVLAYPYMAIETWWAYDILDRRKAFSKDSSHTEAAVSSLAQGDFIGLCAALYNDFEAPMIKEVPVLKELKSIMDRSGLDRTLLSGSGSTMFGIAKTKVQALDAIRKIHDEKIADTYLVEPVKGIIIENKTIKGK